MKNVRIAVTIGYIFLINLCLKFIYLIYNDIISAFKSNGIEGCVAIFLNQRIFYALVIILLLSFIQNTMKRIDFNYKFSIRNERDNIVIVYIVVGIEILIRFIVTYLNTIKLGGSSSIVIQFSSVMLIIMSIVYLKRIAVKFNENIKIVVITFIIKTAMHLFPLLVFSVKRNFNVEYILNKIYSDYLGFIMYILVLILILFIVKVNTKISINTILLSIVFILFKDILDFVYKVILSIREYYYIKTTIENSFNLVFGRLLVELYEIIPIIIIFIYGYIMIRKKLFVAKSN